MDVNKKVWIYDLEQLKNFHSAVFMEKDDPKNVRKFVIHSSRNDMHEYYKFLQEEVKGLIGFNNVRYDYPLMHLFMALMQMISDRTIAEGLNQILYEESQRLIREDYTAIPTKDTKIPQLDLFLIHHFDNKAKMTSLKYVEINIQYPNVQDMPFEHDHWVEDDEVDAILDYNFNDVDATREFYTLSKPLVELRQKLGAKYNLNLRNHNDPKIGEEIFGREISKKTGIRYSVLKDLRTYRRSIDLGQCVLTDKMYFVSKEFNRILEFFKNTTIVETKNAFAESVIYNGFKYDYGTGGLHGCIESGIYEENEEYMILDIDVQGYYPSVAISNKFYPRHLGKSFITVYEECVELKNEAGRTGDYVTKAGMKLANNGVFGKSNDQYSMFYDPMYFMRITINGQLQLSMLAEMLVDNIKDFTMLQVNTDGITIKIPRSQYDQVMYLCEYWEEATGLVLEYAEYKKMIIRDVNNYLAITTDGKAKPKGVFEIIPMQNGAIAYNKNWSMRVVPKAIHAYYIDGIKPEEFVKNHKNIYDFCIGFRSRGDWDLWATWLTGSIKQHTIQQKTIRYYMSNGGNLLTKENREDGRVISLEAGRTATIFNRYYEADNYNIDYGYYIKEINKIINAVDDGQLKLF